MTYPQDIPAFRTVLLNYSPTEDQEETIYSAQGEASVVVQAVKVFQTLRGEPELSDTGLRLLLGSAHLIASGGWHGLAGEAATILAQRAGQLVPVPVEDLPQP